MNFTVSILDGKNGRNGIIRSVGLHDKWAIGLPMGQNRCRSKSNFEIFEGLLTAAVPDPGSTFSGKPSHRHNGITIIIDKTMVEICKTQEGLNVLNLPRNRPLENCLDFLLGHSQSVGRKNITQILNSIHIELALLGIGIEPMMAKSPKNFLDVFLVFFWRIRVDQNIVKIDDDTNIKHVREDVINKPLESRRGVRKAERHNLPFVGAVSGPKGGLPFITFSDSD
ncbi:hypothetical protein HHX47_DHR1001691 [Lentinula edodes]|nr:hypothetical protein HHX47_DHR1001691 [Lentinula edodes]